MKEFQQRLLVIVKNNAEQRMYTATSKIRDICNNLKSKTGNKDFLLIKPAMEISQEKELILKINHFFKKFNELREYVNKEKKLVTTKPMKQAFI